MDSQNGYVVMIGDHPHDHFADYEVALVVAAQLAQRYPAVQIRTLSTGELKTIPKSTKKPEE